MLKSQSILSFRNHRKINPFNLNQKKNRKIPRFALFNLVIELICKSITLRRFLREPTTVFRSYQ